MRLLLQHDTTTAENLQNALGLTAGANLPQITKLLLQNGAPVGFAVSGHSGQPLHVACCVKKFAVAPVLINAGATVNSVRELAASLHYMLSQGLARA